MQISYILVTFPLNSNSNSNSNNNNNNTLIYKELYGPNFTSAEVTFLYSEYSFNEKPDEAVQCALPSRSALDV